MENEPKRENVSEPRGYKDISRTYREGAWPEPGRQIDAAILAASRRAARERHSFARRWAPSLAGAAVLLLASALALKAYREQREAASPSTPDTAPAAHAKDSAPVAQPKAAEVKAAPSPRTVTPPQGFSSTMDVSEAERLERLQRDLGPKGLPSGATPPPAPKAAPAAAATQGAAVFGTGIAPAPASVQAQPPVPAPASVQAQPPAPAQAAAPSAAALPGETARSVRAASTLERSPQAWIEDIRKLMAEGKSDEAGRDLAEFRKRYPDYVLPEDLR